MAIADYLRKLVELKNQLVANLQSMGVAADESEKLNTLVPKIMDIKTGVDTTDATATAEDILKGKTAYVNDVKVTGTAERSLKKLLDVHKSTAEFFKNYDGDSVDDLIEYDDTENVVYMGQMFYRATNLLTIPKLNVSNCIDTAYMFYECTNLVSVPELDTKKVQSVSYMFSDCTNLETVEGLDLRALNGDSSATFSGCTSLKNCFVKNIKHAISFSNSTNLTLESLLFIIQELRTDKIGSYAFTIGTDNINKLSGIYVKLIDITAEMKSKDPYIEYKKPFEVCNRTDTGAISISSYISSKNWTLK